MFCRAVPATSVLRYLVDVKAIASDKLGGNLHLAERTSDQRTAAQLSDPGFGFKVFVAPGVRAQGKQHRPRVRREHEGNKSENNDAAYRDRQIESRTTHPNYITQGGTVQTLHIYVLTPSR